MMNLNKILFVGNLAAYGRSILRLRALREIGYAVTGITTTATDHLPGISKQKSLFSRCLFKLGYPLDETKVNCRLLQEFRRAMPDLLWIEKSLMIRPATLRRMRETNKDVVLASYTDDDMFAMHNQTAYYRQCLPLYDIVFTTKSYNCNPEELSSIGAKRVVFVEKAFDIHLHRPLDLTPGENKVFGSSVGFIGTFEQDRAAKMLFLAQNGIPVRIWGNGWKHMVGNDPNLVIENRPLYGEDYVKAICATKINLCFLRKINRDLQTARSVEIPACGAFMLAERTAEHLNLFEEDTEASYFDNNNPAELLRKVKFYLEHDNDRLSIANAGRMRCLAGKYSHHDRLKFMIDNLPRKQI